jgi:hypothetical protein
LLTSLDLSLAAELEEVFGLEADPVWSLVEVFPCFMSFASEWLGEETVFLSSVLFLSISGLKALAGVGLGLPAAAAVELLALRASTVELLALALAAAVAVALLAAAPPGGLLAVEETPSGLFSGGLKSDDGPSSFLPGGSDRLRQCRSRSERL